MEFHETENLIINFWSLIFNKIINLIIQWMDLIFGMFCHESREIQYFDNEASSNETEKC